MSDQNQLFTEEKKEVKTSTIWTEKYRPQKFEEVKGQQEIVSKIKAFVESGNMPHLLFSGPAGVGKTTLSLVIAKQLFGENWRQNTLELNASDERGIDVIRVKVKDFARTRSIGDVPFKLIYLDESDALTRDAQQALRRTMENYTKTCRFILSCVTPDTKILLPHDREMMVKEFIDQYEHNENKLIHIKNISDDRKSTKKDVAVAAVMLPASSIGKKVLQIKTMTGRVIKVTDDHQLLTIDGWKQAGKITTEDQLLIQPHLEGTNVQNNTKKIVNLNNFIQYLTNSEEKDGFKNIKNATSFGDLKTVEKEKVLRRISELREIIKSNVGLTLREYQLYTLIEKNHQVSRKELQDKMSLSRMGINYLLPSLEKKGFIKRIINKKTHYFIVTGSNPIVLRNQQDIRQIIQKEFDLKISCTAVKRSNEDNLARGRVDRIIGELKRKELLDLTYNNVDKVGALSRICGFLLGDGHLTHNNIRFHFSGNKLALAEVQKDLEILGYSNYSKIASIKLQNTIRERTFTGTSTSFYLDSIALSLLFQFLGISKGDKVVTPYSVPNFVMKGTKFVKREFLRALFGCDADKPAWKRMNFQALSLRQNKAIDLKENMISYYSQLQKLLSEFEVDSYVKLRDKGEVRTRDNKAVFTFNLTITPNNENLFKYFSRIGYAYEKYKQDLSTLSAEYLRHKLHLIALWNKKSPLVIEAVNSGGSLRKVAKQFDVSSDFVANQLKGKKVHLPRKKFLSLDNWKKKYQYNEVLLINEIQDIKEVNEELVMDITCNDDHNFITNGFVSHNCNYSSKIIDPIQSRCAVFRFKPLPEDQILIVVEKIALQEGLTIAEDAKKALYEVCGGDCRRLENIMQSCAVINKNIDLELVYSMASVAKPKEVNEVLSIAVTGDFLTARKKLLDLMLNYGLSGLDIIRQIQKEIWNLSIDDRTKVKLVNKVGEIEFRMVEGSDEYIQLESLLAYVMLAGSAR